MPSQNLTYRTNYSALKVPTKKKQVSLRGRENCHIGDALKAKAIQYTVIKCFLSTESVFVFKRIHSDEINNADEN